MSIPLWLQYTSSDDYFQQDNAPCHKAQIISDWFLEHDNEFTLLKWPPQSPDLNPIEQLWDVVEREIHIMDVQPINLLLLCDAIMSIRTKISEECFQHLVESMPWRIKAVLKAKRGPTRCSVDLSYPIRFCYLPLKQWEVQFDNEKCYLLNYVLWMYAHTTTLNLPLQ